VLDVVADGRWRLEELSVNYRTPTEVMDVATPAGGVRGAGEAAALRARGDLAARRRPDRGAEPAAVTAAVLSRCARTTRPSRAGRLRGRHPALGYEYLSARSPRRSGGRRPRGAVDVLGVDEVKGLEFDGVVVVDPQAVVDAGRAA
jgi:hypothetical protein